MPLTSLRLDVHWSCRPPIYFDRMLTVKILARSFATRRRSRIPRTKWLWLRFRPHSLPLVPPRSHSGGTGEFILGAWPAHFSARLSFHRFGFHTIANSYPPPVTRVFYYAKLPLPTFPRASATHKRILQFNRPGHSPMGRQPLIPSYPPPLLPVFNTHRSVSGPGCFRSPSPTLGPSGVEAWGFVGVPRVEGSVTRAY